MAEYEALKTGYFLKYNIRMMLVTFIILLKMKSEYRNNILDIEEIGVNICVSIHLTDKY